jgi:putative phosphotransacetylase
MNMLDEKKLKEIIFENLNLCNRMVLINVSNRHVHLSEKELYALFGYGYSLTPKKMLKQPGEYACEETVTLKTSKGLIENVRILGPLRPETQVEILQSDTFKLGIKADVRLSGNLQNTCGITLSGPKGDVEIPRGVVVAKRHIHMNEEQAKLSGITDKQDVRVEVKGDRGLIFENVTVRVRNNFTLEMHIDLDEANASCINNGDYGYIL